MLPRSAFPAFAADHRGAAVVLRWIAATATPVRLDTFIQRDLEARKDPRTVIADSGARYFGVQLRERTLLPGDGARLGQTSFDAWLAQQAA